MKPGSQGTGGAQGCPASLATRPRSLCGAPPLPSRPLGGAGGVVRTPKSAILCVPRRRGRGPAPPGRWVAARPWPPPIRAPWRPASRGRPPICSLLLRGAGVADLGGGPAPRLCVTAPRPAAFLKQLFAAWWAPPPTARLRASQRPPRSPLGHCRDCAGAEPMPARGRPGLGCDGAPHVLLGCGSCTRLVSKWAACTPGVGSCPAVSLSWEPCAGRGGG